MNADYVGWAGNGNLGDDACFSAVCHLCAPLQLEHTKDPAAGLCILGGGTLIYGEAFLKPATKALNRGAKIVVLGSGVDLTVPLEKWEPKRREAWSNLLSAAVAVAVRGPDSLEAVKRLGAKEPAVIGDPAITLGTARPPTADHHQRDLVLVNAGSDLTPDCGRFRITSVLAKSIAWLQSVGLRVEYLPLRSNDLVHGAALIERFGLPVVPGDLCGVLGRVRSAHFVISLRLHGAVFAASYGLPFVSLDYRSKCRDFAKSVRMDDLCLPTGTLDFGQLQRAIERIDVEYDLMAKRLNQVCDEYRRWQRDAAASVVDEVS